MKTNYRSVIGVIVIALALPSTWAVAPPDPKLSQEEQYRGVKELFDRLWADHLPEYCLYTQLLPDHSGGLYYHPLSESKYRPLYGPAFWHLHHYCFGLEDTFEASSIQDESKRRSKYYEAITEFDYVLARAPDDFILKPEIYVSKGAALEVLELYDQAVEAYTEAIRLKSNYAPAYVGLSNCFESLGSPERAISIIDAGLRIDPDSQVLLDRRSELTTRADARPGGTGD